MNCPSCGSLLKEHKAPKGEPWLTCSNWPKCKISGTPALLELFGQVETELCRAPDDPPPPSHIGNIIVQVAQLRIHLSKLRRAKTAEERETIRKQALEAIK